jgi:hypothetical protein
MPPEEAAQWVAGPGKDIGAEHRELVARARASVSGRAAYANRTDPISPVPPELLPHVEALRGNAASGAYFAEGWSVAVADLTQILAIQRHVLTDDATVRVAQVDPADLNSIAAVALPLSEPRNLAAAFNQEKQAWVFSSANPNLRIAGQFHGQVQPGTHAFGFIVTISTSFVQVARYRGRHLLRDGYHRAYGFLARGISRVPVFVRDYESFEEMRLPLSLSPQDTYLGERPPSLVDYLDGTVSALTAMPLTQKVVMVQGVEIATLG